MNIYFICTGNTCRSPMAEAILRARQIEGMKVRSAGIHTNDGIPIAENAKALIERGDMPYTATSNKVTEENIEWADYIITMTRAHKHTLLAVFPEAIEKIYTLKGFPDSHLEEDVQDPYGGNLSVYEQTFTELTMLIDRLEQQLMEG